MSEDLAEPSRPVAHFLLLVALAFIVIGSVIASRRPIMGSYPTVIDLTAIPRGADMVELRYYTQAGARVMRMDWRPQLADALGRDGSIDAPPRMGYFARQWTFLGLPVVATGRQLVIYRDTPGFVQAAGVADGQLDELARQTGRRFWNDASFPWWRAGWGLIAPLLIALFVWREHRWQQRRRAVLGLI